MRSVSDRRLVQVDDARDPAASAGRLAFVTPRPAATSMTTGSVTAREPSVSTPPGLVSRHVTDRPRARTPLGL
ncbi:MAG TPA: hypothetical protein VNQ77_20155 [Frankiaceae bacterium]|nr:hypothetical protein [Frankiaceae bacterium]